MAVAAQILLIVVLNERSWKKGVLILWTQTQHRLMNRCIGRYSSFKGRKEKMKKSCLSIWKIDQSLNVSKQTLNHGKDEEIMTSNLENEKLWILLVLDESKQTLNHSTWHN